MCVWWEDADVTKRGKGTYGNCWRVVGSQVVLQYRKVRHACVHEGRELLVTVLGDDEVSSPGEVFAEVRTLYFLDALVDWEWHAIP